jgi:multidrug resistance efflux pump
MNRTRDGAELVALQAEVARLQPLVDKRLVSAIELSALRPKIQALEQTVSQYAPLLDALQKRYDMAAKDLQEVQGLLASSDRESGKDPIKASMQQVTQAYRQAAKNDPFVLRASRGGVVSRIQRQAGDVVVAGEPIVRVASVSSMYITGLLTQRQLAGLAVGDRLQAFRIAGDGRQAVSAQVELIDPEVLDLLDPFNPSPRFPVRGRRVRLRVLDANTAMVPGETVAIQPLQQESWLMRACRLCCFSGCKPSSM